MKSQKQLLESPRSEKSRKRKSDEHMSPPAAPTSSTERHPLQDARSIHKFKNPQFFHKSIVDSGKVQRYAFKNLRQIVALEKQQQNHSVDMISYADLDASCHCLPPLKLSDISASQARYVDPRLGLRYSSLQEYIHLRYLPKEIVSGLLQLRNEAK